MVTDARGHEVPADSDMWGYREDMGLLSASIADVRAVANQAAAEEAITDLDGSGIDATGTVWWFTSPGGLYVYDGTNLLLLSTQAAVDASLSRLPYATAAGTGRTPTTSAGTQSNTTVTFPAGRFTQAPNVVTNPRTTSTLARDMKANSISKSQFIAVFGVASSSESTAVNFDWIAVQQDLAEQPPVEEAATFSARAFAASPGDELDAQADKLAICETPGCANAGIPIPVSTSWTDDEGNVWPIDSCLCGVCGTDITDTLVEGS